MGRGEYWECRNTLGARKCCSDHRIPSHFPLRNQAENWISVSFTLNYTYYHELPRDRHRIWHSHRTLFQGAPLFSKVLACLPTTASLVLPSFVQRKVLKSWKSLIKERQKYVQLELNDKKNNYPLQFAECWSDWAKLNRYHPYRTSTLVEIWQAPMLTGGFLGNKSRRALSGQTCFSAWHKYKSCLLKLVIFKCLFYSLKSWVLSLVSEFERQATLGMGRESGETGTWTPLSHSCRHGSESDQKSSTPRGSESGSFMADIRSFLNNYKVNQG